MNGPVLLLIVVAMIALLIVLVSKVRLHAFLALLLTAVLMGLATRQPPDQVVEAVTAGFGSLMAHIGIVIVLGVIIGDFLEATGGAERIADSVLRVVGKNRSPLAMGIAGGIVSVPVFCDSGFVILTPIWRALSRVGKIPAMTLSAALMAGLLATHVFVPPTPGPIAAAGILGADLGRLVFLAVPLRLRSTSRSNDPMFKRHPKETMTSRERFLAGLTRSGGLDRPPVGNLTSVATVESMGLSGAYLPDAHTNPAQMAALAMVGHEELGFDTVAPYFSVQQEAAAFGCNVQWGSKDSMPDIRENPYHQPEDLPDQGPLLDHPALQTVIGAIRILKKHYGNEVAIIGKVMGPWTLSYHLYGVQRFLMDTILDPDKVRGFLDTLKGFPVRFAQAQFEAGADAVTLADHATGDLVSPDMYRDFLFPIHHEIVASVKEPLILHICGRTTDRLRYIARAGFAAFHFDSKNTLEEAAALAKAEGIALAGYINNPEVLYQGTPDDVRAMVFKAIEAGIEVIGPECAIPLRTPNRNLRALVEACRDYAFG